MLALSLKSSFHLCRRERDRLKELCANLLAGTVEHVSLVRRAAKPSACQMRAQVDRLCSH